MPTYTVHASPPRAGETTSDPQRFVFVRDGFHIWAFLLAPLWLLVHRLWLALVGYVVASALIGGLFYFIGAAGWLKFLGSLLVALFIGFEAASLRRWMLTRRGWRMLGFVVGDDAESAERRFFAEWTRRAATPQPAAEPNYATPVRRGPPTGSDVIGLFPEPGRGGAS
jgi:predicted lipid-binding transport protein (Tim44 family)